jgi:hypothetical protein
VSRRRGPGRLVELGLALTVFFLYVVVLTRGGILP